MVRKGGGFHCVEYGEEGGGGEVNHVDRRGGTGPRR